MRLVLATNLFFLARGTDNAKAKLAYLNEGLEAAREANEMSTLLDADDRAQLPQVLDVLRKAKKEAEGG
jgi:hypothetical protein